VIKKIALLVALLPTLALGQAFRASSGVQMTPRASAPTKVVINGSVWIDSTGSVLRYTNPAGTTITLGSGGGGTLATSYSGGASQSDSTMVLDSTRLGLRIRDNATPITGDLFSVQSSAGATTVLGARATGLTVSNVAQTSGTLSPVLAVTPTANTNMAAGTQYKYLDVGAVALSQQWATGALTTQRFSEFRQPTIAFVGASTVTDASTLHINGAPSAGTNATITNSWSLSVQSGDSDLDRAIVGSTVGTSSLTIRNTSDATIGAQKYSPMARWYGAGWDADDAVSRPYEIGAQLVPVQGNTVTGSLNFYARLNGGAWSSTPLLAIGDTYTTAGKPIIPGFTSETIAPTWVAVSGGVGFTNSYVNFGGAYANSAYWKDATGLVHVYIAVSTGTTGTSPFTLPTGYRPGRKIVFGCYVGTTTGYAVAETNGTFTPAVGNSSTAFIGYVTFPAEG